VNIKLDNKISYLLASGNPGDPSGVDLNTSLMAQDYFYNDSFKDNIG